MPEKMWRLIPHSDGRGVGQTKQEESTQYTVVISQISFIGKLGIKGGGFRYPAQSKQHGHSSSLHLPGV